MKLFFIGDDFYDKSGTAMSPIYEIGTYQRSDWGKVQLVLEHGEPISIRPANEKEMLWAYKKLNDIQSRLSKSV